MSALTHHSPGDLATASRWATLRPLHARTAFRFAAIFCYLLAMIVILFFIYGRGTLDLPEFVYQGF